METRLNSRVYLGSIDRAGAEKLLKLIPKDDSDFKYVISQIKHDLAPRYVYQMKCSDCGRILELEYMEKTTQAEIDKREHYCSRCIEDYK